MLNGRSTLIRSLSHGERAPSDATGAETSQAASAPDRGPRPLRFVIVANARIPSEKAHPLQIMQMAAAFASHTAKVWLVYARRANTDAMRRVGDPFHYFGVERDFALLGLPCFDLIKLVTIDRPLLNRRPLRLLAHYLQLWSFTLVALITVRALRPEVVLSRDLLPLTLLRLTFRRPDVYCFEAHTIPNSAVSRRLHLWAVRRMQRVVVISEALRRWYLDRGIAPERVLLARDAADPAVFEGITRDQARAALGIDSDAPMACYLGHLYPWKGVDTLVRAVPQLDPDVRVFVVGGVPPDLDRIRDAAHGMPNVHLTGHLAPAEARQYVAACDVAIIPFSAASAIARDYTSPLKLFEYMAAGCAIVASDLPSLREVLTDGRNAVLVQPDDPSALAAGISRVLRDHELAARIRRAARAEVEAHTWTRRAASILDFLRSPPEA